MLGKTRACIALTLVLLTVLMVMQPFHTPIPQAVRIVNGAPSWSSPILVDTHRGLDILPSALQAKNGTLWLAWQSNRNGLTTGRTDILYKTYTNGAWSSDHNLTSSGWNAAPSLVQLTNGTVLAFWSFKSGTSYLVYSSITNGGSWSTPTRITTTVLNDTQPAAAVDIYGTVYLTWTRVDSTNPNVAAVKQLYYKTLKNNVWSAETQLTTDSNQNYGSTVLAAKDGIVRVVWSKGAAGNNYQLFIKTYNGTVWTPDTQIVTSSSTDERPSLMQDRNGTLWLFWGRLIVVSQLIQYYDLIGKYSYNLGQSWSSEINLSHNPSTGNVDTEMPSAVQSTYATRPIWVFDASNLNVPDLDIYAFTSSGIGPVHDVVTTGLSATSNLGTTWEYPGGLRSVGQSAIVTVKVTISNIGDYVETVTASLTATNKTSLSIGTVHNLIGPGNIINYYYYWNTSGIKPARYGFTVAITALPGETQGNLGDNYYTINNQLHILPLGDVDQDGSVTLTDVGVVFYTFNCGPATGLCVSLYNPYADAHGLGVIDLVDVGIVSADFDTFT